ncbi:MAG: hypothetical protein WA384_00030 [Rhodomicrobium sp.]
MSGILTLRDYTEWMKATLRVLPDATYELKAFGTDEVRQSVCAYGNFMGTHTADTKT